VSGGNGDKEGNGGSNKGGDQVTAMATKRVMVTAMRVAGDKEGNGNKGKSNGNSNTSGRQATATRAMATVTATRGQW
jgi:hypothetical protein